VPERGRLVNTVASACAAMVWAMRCSTAVMRSRRLVSSATSLTVASQESAAAPLRDAVLAHAAAADRAEVPAGP
jgi:hypothetical protein